MRGYFAIGAERISKPMNLGNLLRSAHAFGAKFFFTIGAHPKAFEARSDTSKACFHLPVYHWATAADMVLPLRCKLVGIELIEGATDFRLSATRFTPRMCSDPSLAFFPMSFFRAATMLSKFRRLFASTSPWLGQS